MSAQDNIQTVKDLYAAFNRGDRNAMTAALTENFKMQFSSNLGDVPWAGVHHGHSGFLAVLDSLVEHIQYDVNEPLDFLASENQVVVVSQLEMTLKRNGQKAVYPEYLQLWTFDAAGKATRLFDAMDPTPLLAAWRR